MESKDEHRIYTREFLQMYIWYVAHLTLAHMVFI